MEPPCRASRAPKLQAVPGRGGQPAAAAAVGGAAQLLDDRASLARAIAVIDAAVSGRLAGHEAAHTLFASGQARLDEQSAARRALLTATRVDFSLVGSTDEDDDA